MVLTLLQYYNIQIQGVPKKRSIWKGCTNSAIFDIFLTKLDQMCGMPSPKCGPSYKKPNFTVGKPDGAESKMVDLEVNKAKYSPLIIKM